MHTYTGKIQIEVTRRERDAEKSEGKEETRREEKIRKGKGGETGSHLRVQETGGRLDDSDDTVVHLDLVDVVGGGDDDTGELEPDILR